MATKEPWDVLTGHRSVSQLQTMSKCGLAYDLERVRKVPLRTATWFIQGNAVHAAAEAWERSGRQLLALDILNAYESEWDRKMAENEAKQPDHSMWIVGGRSSRETDITKRRLLGRQQTIEYVERNPKGADQAPVEMIPGEYAVETYFELDFDGVRVIGYIDQIREMKGRDDLFPVDIKTGTKTPSDPYQIATYKIAIEQLTGQRVDWGYWWMCKDGGMSPPFDLRPYTWDVVAEWYKTMDSMVKQGLYLANPGEGCFTCLAKNSCPVVS